MKKFTALAAAILFITGIQAQEVNFKVSYKPNTNYIQTSVQNTEMVITAGGEEPISQTTGMNMVSKFNVGKLENGIMPVEMAISVEGEQGAAMNGAKLYGKATPGAMPVFDKMDATGMPDDQKDMVMQIINKSLTQVFIPEKKVKAGGSFVQEIPMEIPLGPVTMKLKDVATYTLKKVVGRKAHFDVVHVVSLEGDIEGQNMKGSGTGTGQMVYDMDQTYPVSQDVVMSMEMAFEMQGMAISVSAKSNSKATTVIESKK